MSHIIYVTIVIIIVWSIEAVISSRKRKMAARSKASFDTNMNEGKNTMVSSVLNDSEQALVLSLGYELIEYTVVNYSFRKSLQSNITKNIQPLLYKNKFTKYAKNHYMRELNGLAQFIVFIFDGDADADKLRVWVYYMPIFLPEEHVEYGVELTGTSGFGLLTGKYSCHFSSNVGWGNEVELQHYYDELIPNIQKLMLAIKEGVLPEMDKINSYDRFVNELKNPKASFFGHAFYGSDFRYRRYIASTDYIFFIAIDNLFKKEFSKGINGLKEIVEDFYAHPEYKRHVMLDYSERILECLDCDISQGKDNFLSLMEQLSNEMRKKYKLFEVM